MRMRTPVLMLLPRLLNHDSQEKYYLKIINRYLPWCADAREAAELLRRFALFKYGNPNPDLEDPDHDPLELKKGSQSKSSVEKETSVKESGETEADKSEFEMAKADREKIRDLTEVVLACRKLREAIVATKRTDDFAIQFYLFCIRTTILAGHPESYHPALLHLLRYIRLYQTMTSMEVEETAMFLVLDAACRRRDLNEAYALRREFRVRNQCLNLTLNAMVHNNFTLFFKVKSVVDRYQVKLMEFAEDEMRMHMLKCFGRTYFSIDLAYLEQAAGGRSWQELKEKDGVGWELDGERVTIRRVRAK